MVVLNDHLEITPRRAASRLCCGLCAVGAVVLGLSAMTFPTVAAPAQPPVLLGVHGRTNATPWVAAHREFVAVAWGATLDGKTDVYAAVSRNGGRSFEPPVQVNSQSGEARLGGELPPRLAIIPGSSRPEIVVLWTARRESTATIRISRSRDAGRTFDEARTVASVSAAGDRGWPSLALDRDGKAHAVWLDHRGLAAPDRGRAPRAGQTPGAAHDGVAMAQKSALYYAAIDGTSPPDERALTKGVCYCCKTALASGPRGSLFAAWRHVYPGNLRDIAFSSSRDGGRSFADPARVSEDGWSINGCPDDGPAIAVDAGGVVHAVWPTVISGPEPEAAVFYASTTDGRTFGRRVRVPTGGRPSHPQIAIDGSGRLMVAWDELLDGRRAVAAREVRQTAGQEVSFGPIVTLARQHAMYPVLAATGRGFLAVFTSGAPHASVIETHLIRLPQ